MITGLPSSGFDTGIGGTPSSTNRNSYSAPQYSGGSKTMAGITGSTQHPSGSYGGMGSIGSGGNSGGVFDPYPNSRKGSSTPQFSNPPNYFPPPQTQAPQMPNFNSNFNMPQGQNYDPYSGGGGGGGPTNTMGPPGTGSLGSNYSGPTAQSPGFRQFSDAVMKFMGEGMSKYDAKEAATNLTGYVQGIGLQGGGTWGGGALGGGAGGGGQPGSLGGNLDAMSQYSQGLMDPNSDYFKRLSGAAQEQIGQQSAAQQRASALRGAQSGFGAGAGAVQMATSADIGQAGLEAQGQAAAGLALQAPAMGMQGLQSTFSPYLGIEQLGEQSRQFGANLGENQRQYGVGVGLQQQQQAAQQAWQQAQIDMQNRQMQQEALMNQYAMMYGMF